MKKYELILLLLVLFVGAFFRFYHLNSVPPSPSLDEVTIGWNAYSLLSTGKDEYGYHLPVLLRAYDDYRPALYVYMVIPFVKLLGLNVVAVRLPSVLLSMVTLIATFFLTRELCNKYQYKNLVALLTMSLLAISPWHIYISRLGHEANPGLTSVVVGAWLFVASINRGGKWWLLFGSLFIWTLGLYTYQSEKLFIPLIIFLFGIIYWKELWILKKRVLISIFICFLFALPILFVSFSPGALLRLKGTSAFSDNSLYDVSAEQLLVAKQQHNLIGEVLENRRITTVKIFISNYFSHFNPFWLYGNSGLDSFKAPYTGLFYPWEIVVLLIGVFIFFSQKNISFASRILIVGWVAISFAAPAITTQAPHAMRAFNVLPTPYIIESFGLIGLIFLLGSQKKAVIKGVTIILIGMIGIAAIVSVSQFVHNYFVLYPKLESESFQYPLSQAVIYADSQKNSYQKILVTNRTNGYQSYMFYLFFTKYSPAEYQKNGGTRSGGFQESHQIGNISFKPFNGFGDGSDMHTTLYITNPERVVKGARIQKVFYNLDGSKGLVAWRV